MLSGVVQTLNDMVFENRNKEYGSYWLRKKFFVWLAIGFLTSLLFVLLISISYFWYLKKAGDETIYMSQASYPYLQTTQSSLLTSELLDAYKGGNPEPEKPLPDPLFKESSDTRHSFIVTDRANSDTFQPDMDMVEFNDQVADAGLLVNDSTAFGGFLPGDGTGPGGVFDRIPEFPGGDATKFVERNLRYPTIALKQKIHGVVIISFVISKTGHVTNVKVEKGLNPIIDAEAVKTIKSMPPWKPGMMHGKPINFMFRMPINFVPLS
jgi:protein TonB